MVEPEGKSHEAPAPVVPLAQPPAAGETRRAEPRRAILLVRIIARAVSIPLKISGRL
jgi:hypothetical protein